MRLLSTCLVLAATILAVMQAANAADDYAIMLTRPVHTGERYGITSIGTKAQHVALTLNGQPAPATDEAQTVNLTATAEVLTVSAGGCEVKTRFTITTCTSTMRGVTTTLVPAGTVVVASHLETVDECEFMVGSAPASKEQAEALGMVLTLDSDQEKTNDQIFGTAKRQLVGDTWPVHGDAAAADLVSRAHMTVAPANISGSSTLALVADDRMTVTSQLAMTHVGLPLPPGLVSSTSDFNAHFSRTFPLDGAARALHTAMTIDAHVECAGKTGGQQVTMSMTITQTDDVSYGAP